MARTKGSKNRPKLTVSMKTLGEVKNKYLQIEEENKTLKTDLEKANQVAEQAKDYISDLEASVDFYRKQVNHFLALVNIMGRGK